MANATQQDVILHVAIVHTTSLVDIIAFMGNCLPMVTPSHTRILRVLQVQRPRICSKCGTMYSSKCCRAVRRLPWNAAVSTEVVAIGNFFLARTAATKDGNEPAMVRTATMKDQTKSRRMLQCGESNHAKSSMHTYMMQPLPPSPMHGMGCVIIGMGCGGGGCGVMVVVMWCGDCGCGDGGCGVKRCWSW